MYSKPQPEYAFDLSGGNLCLDFANTISRRDSPESTREHLSSPADVIAFARQSGIVSARRAADLRRYSQHHPKEAGQFFQQAIALREQIFRTFAALSQGEAAADRDVQAIGDAAREALQHRRLRQGSNGYQWQWNVDESNALPQLLWPITQAAAELLTTDTLKKVRFCEASDCQWLFLDLSRNRSRRWCDMTICGNREKARRHYQRTHTA